MSAIWSAQSKHSTWRRLWLALAESEQRLGISITDAQLEEMRSTLDQVDFDAAAKYERELRHDVMAHVHAWGDQVPAARPIIHLGATSCFVTDNSELIQIRDSLLLLRRRLVQVIDQLGRFAAEWRDLPCLGFTHLQPAQPLTVGKRATLWCWDLLLDLEELEHRIATLRFRGVKGTTGTQASFLSLFGGNHDAVLELDRLVTECMGFSSTHAVTGQTYSRKSDSMVMGCLSGIAQSCHKAGIQYILVAVSMYTSVNSCLQEAEYHQLFIDLLGDHMEEHEMEELDDTNVDVFLARLRQSEDDSDAMTAVEDGDAAHHEEEPEDMVDKSDYYDPLYIIPTWLDWLNFVVQCVLMVTNSYGLYANYTSSYYWLSFGKNVTGLFTSIANVVTIAVDWDAFIYDSRRMNMIVDRMKQAKEEMEGN